MLPSRCAIMFASLLLSNALGCAAERSGSKSDATSGGKTDVTGGGKTDGAGDTDSSSAVDDAPATTEDVPVLADTTAGGCASHADCTGDTPFCDASGACALPPAGGAIGWGTGTSAKLEVVFEPNRAYEGTSLDFHPLRDELWVALREFATSAPCEEFNATQQGCQELEGSVAIIEGALTDKPSSRIEKDLNAWHFMRRPTGLAFGDGEFFATCGEARTGNYEDDMADFMGPTLWSADPEIFAQDPGQGLNGSHMDMLHLTPFCMGIAHETENAYWTFNGQVGAVERYDFVNDHGPGYDDHTDGILRRYITGQVKRLDGVPSHLVHDAETGYVYVADSGNGRVLRLDVKDAKPGTKLQAYEGMQESREYTGAEVVEFVAAGVVAVPSGLALYGDALYVSDPSTSRIYAFGLDGTLLRELDTALPKGALAGLTIHEKTGTLFFTEMLEGRVFRVDIAAE